MLGKSMMVACAAVSVLSLPAFAGDRGSVEDQLACTGDVYRLCSQFVPDENRIVACLRQNVNNLSPGCHKVFTRPAPAKGDNQDDDD